MPTPAVNVDAVAASLYALPPDQFTAARDVQVARARQAGDRDTARAIAGLRRPTVAAWLVNLLAHERADPLGDLLELGRRMREAQHDLRGAQLRELSSQRRAAVDRLAAQARGLAEARGHRANLPLDEVVATLNAALSDVEVAQRVRAGRLVRPESYAGFGEVPGPMLRLVEGAPEPESEPVRSTGGRQARTDAARAKLATAQDELATAEEEYQRAVTALDEVSGRLAEVQREHASAQVAVSRATLRRKSAQRGVTVAARSVPPSV